MFEIGSKVEFGVRKYWGGKRGHGGIPRYTGNIVSFGAFSKTDSIYVDAPEYSKNIMEFTKRKNGNWVRKGDADDNLHGYSRVALRIWESQE
jgi:hypothetical protein